MKAIKALKKPQCVLDAEAVRDDKFSAVVKARLTLQALEEELSSANRAVKQALIEADNNLPQCDMVFISWRSGVETSRYRMAIVRSTPGGKLVVRSVGEPEGEQYRFKWCEWRNCFVRDEKNSGRTSIQTELRDVPIEYLPNCSWVEK